MKCSTMGLPAPAATFDHCHYVLLTSTDTRKQKKHRASSKAHLSRHQCHVPKRLNHKGLPVWTPSLLAHCCSYTLLCCPLYSVLSSDNMRFCGPHFPSVCVSSVFLSLLSILFLVA